MKKALALLIMLMLLSLLPALAEAAPIDAPTSGEPAEAGQADAGEIVEGEYHIIVTDGEGPVAGAMVQFCDDTTCTLQSTDESGVAIFRPEEAKVYEVHILVVPEGYAAHDAVYSTPDTWSNLGIVIERNDLMP